MFNEHYPYQVRSWGRRPFSSLTLTSVPSVATFYQIVPLEANLRTQPRLDPKTILMQIKQGQHVEELPATDEQPANWRRVRADLQGTPVEGYVKAFLLKKAEQLLVPAPPPVLSTLPEAHLTPSGPVRITSPDSQAFPLNDPQQPGRSGTAIEQKAQELTDIISYLRVDMAARYRRTATATFCNIYAHDFCHLAGAYLPRVSWRPKALTQLLQGQTIPVRYGTTVEEYNVNSLYNWLEDYGPDFGWRRTVSLSELQRAANSGQVCLIAAQRNNLNAPGHICAVVPEISDQRATRRGDVVTIPLQSQAGATNFRYGGRVWWVSQQFRRFGFWIHV